MFDKSRDQFVDWMYNNYYHLIHFLDFVAFKYGMSNRQISVTTVDKSFG